jgi:hypothetical protein|tara:strand:- start:9000 stop:9221 length:222 start_codon:yes stop_codon:yes gene_type:complete
MLGTWNRVVTAFTPGVASAETAKCKDGALDGTVTIDGFDRVLRTGWVVAAVARHQGTDRVLIEADGQKQQLAH